MTVNVGSITPSATYNKGKVLIVAPVGTSSGNAVETRGNTPDGISNDRTIRRLQPHGHWTIPGQPGYGCDEAGQSRDKASNSQMRGKLGVMTRTTAQRAKAPRCVIETRKQCPAGCICREIQRQRCRNTEQRRDHAKVRPAWPGACPVNRQPIIHFYPRFDNSRRTGSAMTAPSGDYSA